MSFLSILIIAVGLGMDAFSVAIGIGAVRGRVSPGPVLRLSVSFGVFQFFMPILGWLAGRTVVERISAYDHWVAFGLLLFVGVRMIHESFAGEGRDRTDREDPTRGWTLLMLSVATSIDALAVGMTLALLKTPILYPSAVIGVVAFAMTMAGMLAGRRLASLFGRKVELLGGLILIGIGVQILIEHMT
ncbi:MAG TPA: manganese efflux pump MntP family protein [Syntrophales bacterium]|nr:manganese efflux pump MntP family protein [Syntrophales bacterium]